MRAISSLLLCAAMTAACKGAESKASTPKTAADAIAAAAGPVEHFESTRGQFAMDFPSFWKGGYRAVERTDSTLGARMTVEFVFTPVAKEAETTLFVVRVFPSAAWNRVKSRPGTPIAVEAAVKGDDVFTLSFAPTNPYKAGSATAVRFDSLVMSVMNGPPAVRLMPTGR